MALALLVCAPAQAQTGAPPPPAPPVAAATIDAKLPFDVTEVATFEAPWSMAILPDGRMLVTQKKGQMILFDAKSGERRTLSGTPAVITSNQAGLMDVVLAPDFRRSRKIYFSFVEPGEGKTSGLALATAILDTDAAALGKVTIIFRSQPYIERASSYSARIAFSRDGKYLFFASGERVQPDHAQNPGSTLGKLLRLNPDGTPARNNPLAARGFDPAIWTYGQRNLTGLAIDGRGRLWEAEMGPRGGDEVNLIKPGANYGWPKASNGTNYDGSDIPDHRPGDGYEGPKAYWTPSLSPGAIAYYDGRLFSAWRNSLFVTGLSGMALVRLSLDGETATKADHWNMGMRLRSVRTGPDGALWLLEDVGKGRMLKLTPKR